MLDWLASKLGVLIAVAVLTTFVLGLFAWQSSGIADREGQTLADSIAGTLDSLESLDASTRVNLSVETGLPSTIGGKEYAINISSDRVIVSSDGRSWTSGLVGRAVPCNLTERSLNLTERNDLDSLSWTGDIPSGTTIILERARIEVSGQIEYITLVYY